MGGIGSGREAWAYSGTVEESLSIDINQLVRVGAINPYVNAIGTIAWRKQIGQDPAISFETQCYAENGHIKLQYTVSNIADRKKAIGYIVDLFTTKQHFGGRRWWFICPNQECNALASKLYQPPSAELFLCRKCQNLTYRSCRDSGKRDSFIEQLAADSGLGIKQTKKTLKRLQLAMKLEIGTALGQHTHSSHAANS